jgi:SAM-dependent methyltransferase
MTRQSAAWRREYRAAGTDRIESSFTLRPEPSVVWFQRQMRQQGLRQGKILDLGCGRGRNSLPFLQAGWRVEGLDAAPEALRDFRRLVGAQGGNLGLQTRDFQHPLPFPNRHFDAVMEVTAADNLANLRVRARFWQEACRVLKPGGWLFSYHFTPRDGYYGPLLSRSRARSRGLLFDARGRMVFRFYAPGEILKAAPDLSLAAEKPYRYPGPMFGRTYVRDLKAVIFRKKEA